MQFLYGHIMSQNDQRARLLTEFLAPCSECGLNRSYTDPAKFSQCMSQKNHITLFGVAYKWFWLSLLIYDQPDCQSTPVNMLYFTSAIRWLCWGRNIFLGCLKRCLCVRKIVRKWFIVSHWRQYMHICIQFVNVSPGLLSLPLQSNTLC